VPLASHCFGVDVSRGGFAYRIRARVWAFLPSPLVRRHLTNKRFRQESRAATSHGSARAAPIVSEHDN
jgi:hypothetical protein